MAFRLRKRSRLRSGSKLRGADAVIVIGTGVGTLARWRAVLEAGLDSDPADPNQIWTDLTSYLRDDGGKCLHMNRGRQEDSQSFNPAKLTAILDNRMRTFDRAVDPRIKTEKAVRYSLEYPWLPGIVPNSGMDGVTGWSVQGTASALTAHAGGMGISYDGGPGYLGVSLAAGTTGGIVSAAFPVLHTTTYAGSVRLRPNADIQGRISIDWYSGANGTGSLLRTDVGPLTDLPSGAWTRVDFPVVTSPGTAVSAKIHYYTTAIVSTALLDFDSGALDVASIGGLFPQCVVYADSWQRDWDIGDSLCVLTATDGFKPMGFTELNSEDYISLIDSLTPTHHYRLSESGANNVTSAFVDRVTGDRTAHSVIDLGVGPLYNVPGDMITEVDGAFSTVGPSSSDLGHIDMPKKFSLQGLINFDWTVNIWARSPGPSTYFGETEDQGVFVQGEPLFTPDYMLMRIARNGDCSFFMNDGTTFVTLGFDFAGSGVQFSDQLPHQLSVTYTASTKTYRLLLDGVLQDLVVAGAHLTLTPRTYHLGAEVGTIAVTANLELDEYSAWYGTAVSPTNLLALWNRARRLFPAEASDVRIGRVLDLMDWPTAMRRLGAGSSIIGNQSEPFSKANPLQYFQQIETSEQGWFLMDKDGFVRWIPRHALFTDRVIQATFGNGGGSEIPYERCQPVDDNRLIINDAQYSIESGGQLQRVTDAASKAEFRLHTDTESSLLLLGDEDALNAAEWTVDHRKDQVTRIEKLQLNPVHEDAVIARILQDDVALRYIVRTRPTGAAPGTYVDFDVRILGIDHTVQRGKLTVVYDVSTAYTKDYFVLGDTFGSYPMGW